MDFQYQTSTEYEVRDAIVDLYLNVKIRSSDEVIDKFLMWPFRSPTSMTIPCMKSETAFARWTALKSLSTSSSQLKFS
jgi:hypothetical protein